MIYQYTFKWTTKFVKNHEEIYSALNAFNPRWIVIDTETTGLHLKASKPFLIVIAFANEVTKQGYSFAVEWDKFLVDNLFNNYFTNLTYIAGWNIKYDLHMIRNGGAVIDFDKLKKNNVLFADCQILKRLLTNADAKDVSFSMKPSAEQLFGAIATKSETELSNLKSRLKTNKTRLLNTALKPYELTYSSIKKAIENNEPVNSNAKTIFNEYLKNQDIDYLTLYKAEPNLMLEYALNDGVINCELFHTYINQLNLLYKNDLSIWVNECKSLLVFYEIETNGMKVNRAYLNEAINNTKNAIADIRNNVLNITHLEPTQTRELTNWFYENLTDKSLIQNAYQKLTIDKSALKKVAISNNESTAIKDVAQMLIVHRELNKDISTYYQNLLDMSDYDGKVYYQTQLYGTVTGRVSGSFQQFPREPTIYNDKELGFIRKAFEPSFNEGFNSIAYFDFSQMELRVTAHYSITNNTPDENLLKAYIPYNCYHYQSKTVFDYENKNHLINWDAKQPDNKSAWIDIKTNQPWEPTDLHTLTAEHAFGTKIHQLDEHEFKKFRSAAKTTNFCLNYGGGIRALQHHELLKNLSEAEIVGLYKGFYSAYQGATKFTANVKRYIKQHYRIKNMFGRIYSISDVSQNYKAPNWMVQGACADYMKYLGTLLLDYLHMNNYKSRLISQIHDEWQVEVSNADPPNVIYEIKKLLNDEGYKWFKIPLTCDLEITYTNWAEKKGI